MTRSFLLSLAMAFSIGAAAQARDVAPDPLASLLVQRLAAEDGGACVAVVLVEGATRTSFGCSAPAGPAKLDADSIFEIGSVTKGLTGLLLADMVRKGELSLDDTAAKHSPAGVKLPSRGGREITLRDLVTHSSSLPRMPPGFRTADQRDPYAQFDVLSLYEALARTELPRDIGTGYEYSNFGFMWLSDLVSRVGGKPFDQLLAERVLRPLGMDDAAMRLSAEQQKRFVQGHDSAYRPVPPWSFVPELSGVGGVRASVRDMTRLAEALAGRRETPLAETIALALKPIRDAGGGLSIGYGWMTRQRGGSRVHWHNGGTAGARSIVAVNAATRSASVVLVDSAASFDDLGLHLVDASMPLKKKHEAIAMGWEKLAEYEGRYAVSPVFEIRIFLQGTQLMAQGTGQPAFEIYPEEADRFFARRVEAQFVFRRGADGKVDGLVLHQAGREIPAPRAK